MTAKTQPCPVCGGTMTLEKREDVLRYQGREAVVKTLGWWCDSCDEAIFDGAALAGRERAFLELKAQVDEVLGPVEVAKVREKLGLSQRRAGELLGGGPRAFQKYEAGKQAVSTPMSHLLRLLAKDPARLEELKKRTTQLSSEILGGAKTTKRLSDETIGKARATKSGHESIAAKTDTAKASKKQKRSNNAA